MRKYNVDMQLYFKIEICCACDISNIISTYPAFKNNFISFLMILISIAKHQIICS